MKNKGFTLIEILVALALAGLVMTAVYSTYMIQHKAYVVQDQVAAIQQNLRAAMYMMELDFRMAGYDPEGKTNSGLIVNATDDDATDEDSISFTYVAEDDGVTEDTIIYRLYDAYGDGDVDLGRQIFRSGTPPPLPSIQPMAEKIDALDFVYYDGAGNEIDVTAGGDVGDIRVIEVTMVARAYRWDNDYTDNKAYTNALGEIIYNPGDHGYAHEENYRRRTLTKKIRGRNLGL